MKDKKNKKILLISTFYGKCRFLFFLLQTVIEKVQKCCKRMKKKILKLKSVLEME
jgi:hypothetical protein